MSRSRANWAGEQAAQKAPEASRRNCPQNLLYFVPGLPAFLPPPGVSGPRCTAWLPVHRRQSSRSCPARPPACSARRNPGPCAPWLHKRPNLRAGDIYPALHRQYEQISCRPCLGGCPCHALHIRSGDGPVSAHRGRRARPAKRSRSWHNRDKPSAFVHLNRCFEWYRYP